MYLNMVEMIATYAGYCSCPRPVDDVVEVAGLTEKRNSGVVKLSGVSGEALRGQRRRVQPRRVPLRARRTPEASFTEITMEQRKRILAGRAPQ